MVPLTTAVVFPVRGLNESLSQKEGKYQHAPALPRCGYRLNESPSQKEGKFKDTPAILESSLPQ